MGTSGITTREYKEYAPFGIALFVTDGLVQTAGVIMVIAAVATSGAPAPDVDARPLSWRSPRIAVGPSRVALTWRF
jgi:hypothetical protein